MKSFAIKTSSLIFKFWSFEVLRKKRLARGFKVIIFVHKYLESFFISKFVIKLSQMFYHEKTKNQKQKHYEYVCTFFLFYHKTD